MKRFACLVSFIATNKTFRQKYKILPKIQPLLTPIPLTLDQVLAAAVFPMAAPVLRGLDCNEPSSSQGARQIISVRNDPFPFEDNDKAIQGIITLLQVPLSIHFPLKKKFKLI